MVKKDLTSGDSSFRPTLYVVTLVLIYAAFIGLFVAQMRGSREDTVTKKVELAESLTNLLDDQMQRSLQSVSILSDSLVDQFFQRNSPPDLQRFMAQISNMPELRGIVFADADGRVVASSIGDDDIGADISATPGFVASQKGATSTTHIGAAVSARSVSQTSTGGPPFIPLTRSIMDRQGVTRGFIVALLSVNYFEMQYSKLLPQKGETIYLSRYDGALLASNRTGSTSESWFKNNPIFISFLPNIERGVVKRDAPFGAEILAFRVTRHWPVIVAVGLEEAVLLEKWREFATKAGLAVLFLLALISASMAILMRKDQVAARQRAFLQSIIENMSDGLIVYDRHGKSLVNNVRFLNQFSLTQASLLDARQMAMRILRQTRSSSSEGRQAIRSVMRGERASAEAEMKDGLVLDIRSAPMPDECTIFLVSDVTQRYRDAQDIRVSEATKNAIITSALDCVIVTNSDGCIVEFNPGAERTFGWRAEEVLGREIAEVIVPQEMRESHREGMKRFVRTRSGSVINRRIEIPALRRDGEVFPCELAIALIEANGEICFAAYLRDISARKRIEADLKGAQESAERANLAKSAFLAHISHEIRTPMNSVVGYSELLKDTSLDGEQKQFVEGISESADALLYLINNVLDLSQLEAGKLGVSREPFRLASVIENVATVTNVLARSKDIEFHLHCGPESSGQFLGDIGRLRQILLNLTGNAVKFTHGGSVTLSADILQAVDGSLHGVFLVRDTGIGIASDALQRVFKPFEQADGSQRIEGSGLGLSISRDLARLMGGDITVESELGKGSVFRLEVPLERANVAAEHSEVMAPRALAPGRRLKILVAEDTPASRFVLCKSLEKRGHETITAEDGAQALALAQIESPDLIFMDIQMPVMNGLEAARRLRASNAAAANIPIIALTAQSSTVDREAALAAGMVDFIAKPVRPADLDRALAVWGREAVDAPHQQSGDQTPDHSMLTMLIEDIGAEAAWAFMRASLDNARVLLHDITDKRPAGDIVSATRHVHSLAGLFAQMGFDGLATLMKDAETSEKSLRDLDVDETIARLEEGMTQMWASQHGRLEEPQAIRPVVVSISKRA